MSERKRTGKVKWFNAERAYGFIVSPSGDIFFHLNDCEARLAPEAGDRVGFTAKLGPRGWEARGVRIVEKRKVRP